MIAAAAITPCSTPSAPTDLANPYGMNGCMWLASKCGSAIATKRPSAMILTTTRIALRVALSLVPAISSPATAKVINTAGRLSRPPACGPALSASGRSTPRPFKKPTA
jgi:hypothetical protein